MKSVDLHAVVIGASAGALDALSTILPSLSANCPFPVIIVVHLPPDKDSLLANILGAKCKMAVREAEDKEMIEAGTVYLAPSGYHLLIEQDHTLSLSNEEEINFSRPSIDALFETAADAYGPALTGIILTGANDDGAAGLQAVMAAGGQGIVQQPEQAFSPFMPKAALHACPHARVLSLDMIAVYLNSLADKYN